MGYKYSHNTTYFKNVNTPAKSYILGFLYGDGFIINNNRTVGCTVKDKDVLQFIKKSFQYTGPIQSYREGMYTLRINSKELCEDLNCLGMLPRKSKILKFPNFVPSKLIDPFICGLFDADGYIYIPKQDYKWKQYRKLGFSGTENIVSGVKKHLESVHSFSKTQLKEEKGSTFTTHYVTKHVEMFWNQIYSKSPYRLQRKEAKFKDNEIVYARLKK